MVCRAMKEKMKKLMTFAAVVIAAAITQAASFQWKTAAANQVYVAGSTTEKLTSGMAYIFADAGTTTQSHIFEALAAGTDISTLGSLDKASVSSGAIGVQTAFDWGNAGDTLNAFFAIVDGDSFYISTGSSAIGPGTGAEVISFKAKASSQAAAMNASKGYKGAGWYTAAVPEPTSGLLMLLGMAGLALRRRRA